MRMPFLHVGLGEDLSAPDLGREPHGQFVREERAHLGAKGFFFGREIQFHVLPGEVSVDFD